MRLFVLLEVECNKLDKTMELSSCESGPSYEKYALALHSLTIAKDEQLALRNGLQVLEQLFTHLLTVGGVSSATNPLLVQLMTEITNIKAKLQEKVKAVVIQAFINMCTNNIQQKEIDGHNATLKSGFHKEEGPFVKALDKALASFNVQRQAYYSGTFVGNHVHRALGTTLLSSGSFIVVLQM